MRAVEDDSEITNAEEFAKHFIQNSDGTGGLGIVAPGNVKYIISFYSTVDPSEVDSMPSQKTKMVEYKVDPDPDADPELFPVYMTQDGTQYIKILSGEIESWIRHTECPYAKTTF